MRFKWKGRGAVIKAKFRLDWQNLYVGVCCEPYPNAVSADVCFLPCLVMNLYVQWGM